MSIKKEGKSQAEIYREERKARLEKAAKKNASKSPEMLKRNKNVGLTIGICLIVVAVLIVAGLVVKSSGVVEKNTTALVVNKTKISTTEYQYYYTNTYYNLLNYSSYYDYMYGAYISGYGAMMTGLDSTKLPSKQEYKGDEIPESEGIKNPTMEDYLKYATKDYIQNIVMMYDEAVANGIELNDEEKTEALKILTDMETNAKEQNYRFKAYFNLYFRQNYKVKGMTQETFKNILLREALANKYSEQKETEFKAQIEKEGLVQKTYEEKKDDYDIVDVAIYSVTGSAEGITDESTDEEKTKANTEATEKAKADADAFLASATDANSFESIAKQDSHKGSSSLSTYDKSKLTSSYSEEVANWVFDDARKVGEKTLIEKKATTTDDDGNTIESGEPSTFYVVCIKTLPYLSTSSDVRHILIKFETDDSETSEQTEEVSAETKAAALKKAEEVLAEWKKGAATEDSFTELAKKYSQDVDEEGNLNNDGLYEDVTPTSNYVENFLKWSTDSSRKAGDTGIIETEYGYHIMYYSKSNGASWTDDIEEELAHEKLDAFTSELEASDTYKVKENKSFINYAVYCANSFVKYYIANPIDYSQQMQQ